ncbi:MAG: hypothetical protein AAGU76_03245 [Sedimentibacter sp.]|uniref:hypothetical protein n=1 Tax=Sedimentibacter sp. TaxID=1960295 RepID=UPI003158199B
MSYSNYRNDTPHYNSMPYGYEHMGYAQGLSGDCLPGMPPYGSSMYMQNYMPSTPFMASGMQPASIPTIPNMPSMPGMPNMMPGTPFIPDSQMDDLPDGDMPALPRSTMPMPEMRGPGGLPAMPGMPPDGNRYPGILTPGTGTIPMEMTCEQLMELARNMNCMEYMQKHMEEMMEHDNMTQPQMPGMTTPQMPRTTMPTPGTTPQMPRTTTPTPGSSSPAAPGGGTNSHNNHTGNSRSMR